MYRKEHTKNKKRSRKSAAINSEDSADASTSPNKLRPRGLSEDNISSSGSTFEKNENCSMKDGKYDLDIKLIIERRKSGN